MNSGEISTGLTRDSQYIKIYNFQYIKILCIYSQYLNIRIFPIPVVCYCMEICKSILLKYVCLEGNVI